MLVPSSAPLPTNGQTPISANRIARSQAALARVDRAEKRARFAVLGFCNGALSFAPFGKNIMADVFQTPMVPLPNARTSSTTPANGSGILDTSANMAAPAPVVYPLNGSGDAVPNDPEYAPLTASNSRAAGASCPLEFPQPVMPASDYAAPWGNTFALPEAVPSGSSALDWAKSHAGLILVGLLIAGAATMGSKR